MGYHGDVYSRRDAQIGAFYADNSAQYKYMTDGDNTGGKTWSVSFGANRSSTVFGGASTVQPSSLLLLPCIKI